MPPCLGADVSLSVGTYEVPCDSWWDMMFKTNVRKGIAIILFSIVFFATMPLTSVMADIAPVPNSGSSIGMTQTISSYLGVVNVTLTVYSEITEGHGIFIVRNPSNESENLNLYFDPGNAAKDVRVEINGFVISTLNDTVNNKLVTKFNTTVNINDSSTISIDWKVPSKVSYSVSLFKTKITKWQVGYLIIGKGSWQRSIESVSIIFDMKTKEFEKYHANIQPTEESVNQQGFPVLKYQYNNFSNDELFIMIGGDSISDYTNFMIICGVTVGIIVIVVALVGTIMWKNKKRK